MNKISDRNTRTVVKIFIKSATVLGLVLSPQILSAQTTPASPIVINNGENPDTAKYNECKEQRQAVKESNRKIAEACRKAGLGSECSDKATECSEAMGSQSFDTIGALGSALGIQGLNAGNIGNSCPQMGGRDYFTEKDRIQKEIKDVEKDLADLGKEKSDVQKDYDDEVKDIQEALTKAQEDYKQKELDIDAKQREQVSDFQTAQAKAAEDMRTKGSQILDLRGKLINLQRSKATALIDVSQAVASRECKKKMLEAKKAYDAVSSGSSSRHISAAKQKKADLINIFNECMVGFDQKRMAVNENVKQQQDMLNKQIADLQSSVDEIQNSLNLASSQLEEMKKAATTEKQNALQSVIDLGTRSQSQMQAAYNRLQTQLQSLAARSDSLNKALNAANNSLMNLGPAPPRGSEYSPSQAASEINAEMANKTEAESFLSANCDTSSSSSSSRSGSSSKKTGTQ